MKYNYKNKSGLGLYIHVPFCLRKCRYCDFISYPYDDTQAEVYVKALQREMILYGRLFNSGYHLEIQNQHLATDITKKKISSISTGIFSKVSHAAGQMRSGDGLPSDVVEFIRSLSPSKFYLTSIFVGGGTPTCLPAPLLAEIFKTVKQVFTVASDVEFTVEANPGTVNEKKLTILRNAGVNRLSLGVQTCQPRLLNMLGRIHTFDQALDAVKLARCQGFNNINLDLIFGIPGQSLADWQTCLEQVIALNPEHLSLYGLQLEEGTPLQLAVNQGSIEPCDEEAELEMYQYAISFLKKTGFDHYEISNFAKPDKYCRHNILYWEDAEYLGVGPGAYSYLNKVRFANSGDLDVYAKELKAGRYPVVSSEKINRKTEMSETVFLSLRMLKGLDLEAFSQRFAIRAEDLYKEQIKKLTNLGLIKLTNGFLHLTEKGLPLANMVFREFV